MAEDVEVPKVGKVDKKVVAAIVVGAAGFVGYRYWQASHNPTADAETTDVSTENPEFDDTGDPSTVLGAVRPNNDYGIPSGDGVAAPSTDDFGFKGTTNDAWTQYAANQLSQSDRWTYTDVVEALGNYLAQRPTTATQQNIVNAAIAVAGQPPQGAHTLVSGGNVPLTVAPTITKIDTTGNSAVIAFTSVAGADSYRAYRGTGGNVGTSKTSPLTVTGLQPNTSYDFSVRAVTASGKLSPPSGKSAAKTKPVNMTTPKTPTVSKIGTTTAIFTVPAVSGATGYNWFVNGHIVGHSDAPKWSAAGLRSKTAYKVTVQADNATQAPTSHSPVKSFTTK